MRMREILVGLGLVAAVIPVSTFAQGPPDSTARQETGLRCEEIVFCAGIKEKAPVGVSETFPSDIYRVYCYTAIVGAPDTTAIVHTWYYGETEMAAVDLKVKTSRWRTWSSKRMMPGWRGRWKVEVTTSDGAFIASKEFSLE